MSRTIPALVTERLTDAIAMLLLAGVGITTYAADKVEYLIILGVITDLDLAILSNKKAMDFILVRLEPFPIFDKIIPRICCQCSIQCVHVSLRSLIVDHYS